MTSNLLADGYDVVVYDVDDEAIEAMVEEGAQAGTSAQDVTERATVVMTSLLTSEIVTDVYFGDDGVLNAVDEETMLVETSTVDPSVVERIAEAADGNEVVDAPVIGPPPKAAAATLTIVAGCSDAAFERVRPILEPFGERIDHVGEVGSANRIKLANNVMTFGNWAIAAEMTALVKKTGIDQEQFFEITSSGTGGSPIVDMKMPKSLVGDHEPGLNIDGARSDLQYAIAMKEEADFSTPLASAVADRFTYAAAAGHGDKDYTVMTELFAR